MNKKSVDSMLNTDPQKHCKRSQITHNLLLFKTAVYKYDSINVN